MTQSFCILAALWGLVAVGFLVLSYIPSLSAPGRGPLVSTISAFAAGQASGWAQALEWGSPRGSSVSLLIPSSLHAGGHGGVHQ